MQQRDLGKEQHNGKKKVKERKKQKEKKNKTKHGIDLLLLFVLGLLDTSTPLLAGLLASILLELASAVLLGLDDLCANLTELGLETLGDLEVLINKTEANSASTTKVSLETPSEDGLRISDLEHLGKKFVKLSLGHATTARVQNVDNKLLTLQKTVDRHATNANGARRKVLFTLWCLFRHLVQ